MKQPYDDHLRLIEKRVVDFLSVLIEFFSLGITAEELRANIGWKSAISLQWVPVDPKFQVEGVAPTNHSSSQKTSLNDLSYDIKIWNDLSSILSQITHLTDGRTHRRTDGQTEFWSLDRVCIAHSAVKTSGENHVRSCKLYSSLNVHLIHSNSRFGMLSAWWEHCPRPPTATDDHHSKMTRIKSHGLSKFCYVVPPFTVTSSLLVVDCACSTDLAKPWISLACHLQSQKSYKK